jgi:hypothetical protein
MSIPTFLAFIEIDITLSFIALSIPFISNLPIFLTAPEISCSSYHDKILSYPFPQCL